MARGDGTPTPGRGRPGDVFDLPATTRIGAGGGPGRGLRAVVALAAVALVLAVVKPWDWGTPPPTAPGRADAAVPGSPPAASAAPATERWTGLSDRVSCLSGRLWMAVVDRVDGPTATRSWTRLDVVPVTGPGDPAIARIHAYAEAVPRLGFCAPAGTDANGTPAAAAFRVDAWRIDPGGPANGSPTAASIDLRPAAGGTPADHGALYGPPTAPAGGNRVAPSPDPEMAWARDAGLVPGPATWSPEASPAQASWPAGTYVFRVEAAGAVAGGTDATWFAIELRGPWTGPADVPEAVPPTVAPGTTPGSPPAP